MLEDIGLPNLQQKEIRESVVVEGLEIRLDRKARDLTAAGQETHASRRR